MVPLPTYTACTAPLCGSSLVQVSAALRDCT